MCLRLLRSVRCRLPPGGALLIGEMLLNDPRDEMGVPFTPGPVNALMQDLNMLVQTSGRERSLEGYRRLLAKAGWDPEKVHGKRTGAYLDSIIAYK